MKAIVDISDKVACGKGEVPNTGKLGCLSLFGTPEHLLGLRRGFCLDATKQFDIAMLVPEIQKGNIIPIIGASSFEDVSAEDTYSTNSSGVKRLNLKGLPEYKLTFEEGHEFYRELDKIRTFKSLDFIIGDDEGNWMYVPKAVDRACGFTAGHVTPELTKRKVKGGDAESKALLVQFLDRLQFDRNYAILHANELDFYPEDIPSVNGVHIKFSAIPSSGDTTLAFELHLNADHGTLVEGLDTSNFLVKVNGATVTASINSPTPGEYVATISSLSTNDVVEVSLFDSALNSTTVYVGGVLYAANPISSQTIQ